MRDRVRMHACQRVTRLSVSECVCHPEADYELKRKGIALKLTAIGITSVNVGPSER